MPGIEDASRLGRRAAPRPPAWPARLAGLAGAGGNGLTSTHWHDRATRSAAALALLVALLLTVSVWRLVELREREAARIELETRMTQTVSRLTTRMLAYEQILRGGAALVASVGPIGRGEWRSYVRTLGLEALPGIEGLGWAPYVPAPALDAHLEAARRGGASDYRLTPAPDGRDAFGPVMYLEPFSKRIRSLLGDDMYQDPVRRLAMQEARDRGEPSMTARLPLSDGKDGPTRHGFFVYVPAYRPGVPTDTVEQRRAALIGWVYAPFDSGDFLQSALGADGSALHLDVHDEGSVSASLGPAGVVPRADEAGVRRLPVRKVNREWRVDAWPVERSGAAGLSTSDAIAVGSGLASLLLFGIVWTQASTRSRALGIADRMAVALRQSNETLEARVQERTASLRESNERLPARGHRGAVAVRAVRRHLTVAQRDADSRTQRPRGSGTRRLRQGRDAGGRVARTSHAAQCDPGLGVRTAPAARE